jgi:hypothetical protein
MEYERLVLEVGARKAGFAPVVPRAATGNSGVEHRFSSLFTDGRRYIAFDFYDSVSDKEVLRSYTKKLDVGCSLVIVAPLNKVAAAAKKLAHEYSLKIIDPKAVPTYFVLELVAP